jgi:hypothetical protein
MPGPTKRAPGHSGVANRPPLGKEKQDDQHAGVVESQATSGVAASMEGWQKTMTGAGNIKDLQETLRNCQESPNGNRVTTEKQTGGVANCRETSGRQQKRVDAGVHIKAPPSHVDCQYRKGRP